jgi:hypothetical protein
VARNDGLTYSYDLSPGDLIEMDRLADMGRGMAKPGVELVNGPMSNTMEAFAFDLGYREGLACRQAKQRKNAR